VLWGWVEAARRRPPAFLAALPEGRPLPADVWRRRHRGIVILLWLHAIALAGYGWYSQHELATGFIDFGLLFVSAALASWARLGRRARSILASLGLLTASAVMVHLSGGVIEMHFHFFVMLIIIALYEDWAPLLLAIGYVGVEHGLIGLLDSRSVYNHRDGMLHPWKWAGIHAAFVLGESVACVIAWRLGESARQKSELLLASAAEGICGLDTKGRIQFVNPEAARLLQRSEDELMGELLHEVVRHTKSDGSACAANECPVCNAASFEAGGRLSGDLFHRKDGSAMAVECVSTPIRRRGRVTGTVVNFTDISARLRAQRALAKQALYDGLTGLPNRNLLNDRLSQAIRASQRKGHAIALLLMDLNRFKEVNDTLGHEAGDQLLQELGLRLRGALRISDTVARLGGDEFAILLSYVEGSDGAAVAASKVLLALTDPFVLQGQAVQVDGSIGIALCPQHGQDAATLLRRADLAMYAAKRSHAGSAFYQSEMDRDSAGRLALAADLSRAVAAGELRLEFQPRLDLPTLKTEVVEALVRWQHPERGLLGPDEFISLAEQTGAIHELSRWVLEGALRQAALWADSGLDLAVAVNLSMRDLADRELPAFINDAVRRRGLTPRRLIVEITESSIMSDPAAAGSALAELRAMGVRLAIDDFGTGYSSMSYLTQLVVDELKIDRSFVGGMASDPKRAAIVRAVIELAHALGVSVTAEGVEDGMCLQVLRSLYCDAAQGYHVCRPAAAADLEPWLAEHAARRERAAA